MVRALSSLFPCHWDRVAVHPGSLRDDFFAEAFTAGAHIYLRKPALRWSSVLDRQLLGHELWHVLQQSREALHSPRGPGPSILWDAELERDADLFGLWFASAASSWIEPDDVALGALQWGPRSSSRGLSSGDEHILQCDWADARVQRATRLRRTLDGGRETTVELRYFEAIRVDRDNTRYDARRNLLYLADYQGTEGYVRAADIDPPGFRRQAPPRRTDPPRVTLPRVNVPRQRAPVVVARERVVAPSPLVQPEPLPEPGALRLLSADADPDVVAATAGPHRISSRITVSGIEWVSLKPNPNAPDSGGVGRPFLVPTFAQLGDRTLGLKDLLPIFDVLNRSICGQPYAENPSVLHPSTIPRSTHNGTHGLRQVYSAYRFFTLLGTAPPANLPIYLLAVFCQRLGRWSEAEDTGNVERSAFLFSQICNSLGLDEAHARPFFEMIRYRHNEGDAAELAAWRGMRAAHTGDLLRLSFPQYSPSTLLDAAPWDGIACTRENKVAYFRYCANLLRRCGVRVTSPDRSIEAATGDLATFRGLSADLHACAAALEGPAADAPRYVYARGLWTQDQVPAVSKREQRYRFLPLPYLYPASCKLEAPVPAVRTGPIPRPTTLRVRPEPPRDVRRAPVMGAEEVVVPAPRVHRIPALAAARGLRTDVTDEAFLRAYGYDRAAVLRQFIECCRTGLPSRLSQGAAERFTVPADLRGEAFTSHHAYAIRVYTFESVVYDLNAVARSGRLTWTTHNRDLQTQCTRLRTEAERERFRLQITNTYRCMNRMIAVALLSIAPYRNADVVVRRGFRWGPLPDAVKTRYATVGGVVSDAAPTSASWKETKYDNQDTLCIIDVSTENHGGASIDGMSAYPEGEVLFPPCQSFQVVRVFTRPARNSSGWVRRALDEQGVSPTTLAKVTSSQSLVERIIFLRALEWSARPPAT